MIVYRSGGQKKSTRQGLTYYAQEIGVTKRHVQRMYAQFKKTGGTHHVPLKPGRKRSAPVPDGRFMAGQ